MGFECSIGRKVGQRKILLMQFLLTMGALLALPAPQASAQQDSWRRTANGWERTESWNQLVTAPIGTLRPLTIGTLFQRTWPATLAAAELSLVLAILHFGWASMPSQQE
jgi:hypothetical protein